MHRDRSETWRTTMRAREYVMTLTTVLLTAAMSFAQDRGGQRAGGSHQISATGQMYRGPGAPATGPQHHYMFEVFALDTKLDVQPSAGDNAAFETRANVMKAMQGHILGKAVYGGLFKRPQ